MMDLAGIGATVGTTIVTFFTVKILEKVWEHRHRVKKLIKK